MKRHGIKFSRFYHDKQDLGQDQASADPKASQKFIEEFAKIITDASQTSNTLMKHLYSCITALENTCYRCNKATNIPKNKITPKSKIILVLSIQMVDSNLYIIVKIMVDKHYVSTATNFYTSA